MIEYGVSLGTTANPPSYEYRPAGLALDPFFEDAQQFGLQVERMIRDANNPARRAFRDVGVLQTWLGEVLAAAEKTRLQEFLGGH